MAVSVSQKSLYFCRSIDIGPPFANFTFPGAIIPTDVQFVVVPLRDAVRTTFCCRSRGIKTTRGRTPLSAPEIGHQENGDKKGRQPRPFFASLRISRDQPTAWWRTQSKSNPSLLPNSLLTREINRE